MAEGKVVEVIGPVVDIRFPAQELPQLREAIDIELSHGERQEQVVLEVALHLGNETVRCVALAPTEGLRRGTPARSRGGPIAIPVGPKVLGRLFNVLGQPIDGRGPGALRSMPGPGRYHPRRYSESTAPRNWP